MLNSAGAEQCGHKRLGARRPIVHQHAEDRGLAARKADERRRLGGPEQRLLQLAVLLPERLVVDVE